MKRHTDDHDGRQRRTVAVLAANLAVDHDGRQRQTVAVLADHLAESLERIALEHVATAADRATILRAVREYREGGDVWVLLVVAPVALDNTEGMTV